MLTPRFFLTPVAAAAVLSLWLPLARAQTTPAEPGESTLGTITVNASADASAEGLPKPFAGGQVARGSRIGILGNQDVMDTPFSNVSYTSELIQDQQAKSIGDVLMNDASVRQARGFGNFQQAYFIRGFPVFSDDVAYNGLYGLVPRQYMATELVERVELFRGANTFLSGVGGGSVAGGGLGGLINVVPKRAPNEALNRITAGFQTGGEGYVAADIARRFGPDQATGLRLNAARRDGGSGVDNEKQTLNVIGVGLDWRSRNLRVSADVGYQDQKLASPRPSVDPGFGLPVPAAPDARTNFAQPWTHSNSKDSFGTLRVEGDLNEQWTGWAAIGAREGKEDNVLASMALTDTSGNARLNRFDNTRENSVTTAEVGLRGKFQTGVVKHTLSVAANSLDARERNAFAFNFATGLTTNIYRPVASPAPSTVSFGVLGSPRETNHIKATSFAVSDTLSMAGDTLLLTLGVRHQNLEDTNFAPATGVQTDTYDKSRLSPTAGLVFKIRPDVSLYANYIEGLVKGATAPLGTTNQGATFEPYVSKQKEIGAKYDGGKVGASMAFFSTDQPSGYAVNNTFGIFGKQRNQGLEFSVFGEPAKGVRVLGGLTLLDAKQVSTAGGVNDGKNVIGVPKQQFNLGAEWDVTGMPGLALNARLIHTGKQYADAANTQALPAWNRLDVGARYLVDLGNNKVMTLRGRIDNFLDKSYWASAGGFPGAGYMVVGAPRTFSLTASVDF